MCDLRNIMAAAAGSAVQSHSSHFWEKAVSSARGLYQAIQSLNIGGEVRSRAAAGVPEKIRYLGSSSRLVASLLALLLLMVALPASPASAVTVATEEPQLISAELLSAPSLVPGQTVRVRFVFTQPVEEVRAEYSDSSRSQSRYVKWVGSPGSGAVSAEATAVIDGADYYDGLQQLRHVSVTYQPHDSPYRRYTGFKRNSTSDYLNVDGLGNSLLQAVDFKVDNPSRPILVPKSSLPPSFEPATGAWNNGVDGTISPGVWTNGVEGLRAEWIAGGVSVYSDFTLKASPFRSHVPAAHLGKWLTLRVTSVTPGFEAVSVESAPYLFVAAGPFVITGKPWIGSTLNTTFNVKSLQGIPAGVTPKVEVFWRSRSTDYAGVPVAPGVGYVVNGADGGGSVSAMVVISVDGKVVGRYNSNWTANVSNPAPTRTYDSRNPFDHVLARSADGRLWQWGTTFGSLPKEVGTGWNVFDKIFSPGDFNEDGYADVLARKPSGELWMYPADGKSWWKPASVVGVGWQGMTELIAPGDFDEDGHDDVLARDREGRLLLYPGNGKGGWLAPRQVGAGWNIFNRVFSIGDFDGDSHADILATNAGGQLFLYSSNGKGGWLGSKVIGSGWQSFKGVFSAGDRDGDGWTDIYGIDGAGYMYLYPFKSGSWKPRTLVGADWDVFTALF